jgi:hypothetical protein
MGWCLINISEIEKYIARNTPLAFPEIRKYLKGYVYSLLRSGDVVERLALLESHTNAEVPDGDHPFNGMLLIHRELHSFAASFSDYRYQYILAYSRLRKDVTLFQAIGDLFFGLGVSVVLGGSLGTDVISTTDELHDMRLIERGYKSTDQGYFTDQVVRGVPILMYAFECVMDPRLVGRTVNQWKKYIDEVKGLLLLTVPARLQVVFHATPYFYVGKDLGFDLDFVVTGEGHLQVSSGLYDLSAFRLVEAGDSIHLYYDYLDDVLPIYREGDHVWATVADVNSVDDSPSGLFVRSSPFNDEAQMQVVRAYISEGRFSEIYRDSWVECDGLSSNVVVEVRDDVKIITVTAESSVSFVRIRSGVTGLEDIYCQIDVERMPYFETGSALYSVKLYVDFG